MISMLDSYSDPQEFMLIVEQTDFHNRNCLWYLDEFDLYKILDHRMVDNIMNEYWEGQNVDVNCSIFDYSTSVTLLQDKNHLMIDGDLMTELRHEALDIYKYKDKTH